MANKLNLPSYESLLQSGEQARDNGAEKVVTIPIDQIRDFEGHPFHVSLDQDMLKLIDSIQENGQMVPVFVRPAKDGNGYEMIAGHRRKFAFQQLGMTEIQAIVRDLDDDAAVIIMVDSNLQRENILPSERAKAYKMKMDALKRQGTRTDLTSCQVGTKLRTDEKVADGTGDSARTVQRFIRLTQLEQPLLDMVDEKKIAMNPAVELSYLKPDEQKQLLEAIDLEQSTPSLSQAQRMKKFSQEGRLTFDVLDAILSEEKKPPETHITLTSDKISKYFPKSFTPEQMEKTIIKLLEKWCCSRQRSQER